MLLPRGARRKANTWKVPRKSKGVAYGFGQSNVWYAQGREQHNLLDQFLNRIVSQIENYDGENWIDKYAEGMEIPKETEVIDVCKSMSKAIEDLLKESREQGIEIGKIQTLVRLVQKGDLKIERAAVNVQMTVEQLRKMMEKTSV